MKIEFWWIGKTNEKYLKTGIDLFSKRIKHYYQFSISEIKDVKKVSSSEVLKLREAEAIIKKVDNRDFLILLDEKGSVYNSVKFADHLEKLLINSSYRRIIFLIAGAYGADDLLKQRANQMISLSNMTFSHQMIRVIFLEQLYRACTIIKNEKYHNE